MDNERDYKSRAAELSLSLVGLSPDQAEFALRALDKGMRGIFGEHRSSGNVPVYTSLKVTRHHDLLCLPPKD